MKKWILFFMMLISFSAYSQIDCVVISWNSDSSSYSVVNYNYKTQILPVTGLTEGLEILVKRTPYAMPTFDGRLQNLITTYSVSEDYDSIYTSTRKWVTTYSFEEASDSEKIVSVEEAESLANSQVLPSSKQLKYLCVCIGLLVKERNGGTLTTNQEAILDKIAAKAVKMWTNHNLAENKKDSIEAGAEIDIDYGWENTDDEDDDEQ